MPQRKESSGFVGFQGVERCTWGRDYGGYCREGKCWRRRDLEYDQHRKGERISRQPQKGNMGVVGKSLVA